MTETNHAKLSDADLRNTFTDSTVLITGVAGFIGYWVAESLLSMGANVVGVDNLNDYYDPGLKELRLQRLREQQAFEFLPLNIADKSEITSLFERCQFNIVINLAAQAGVRYSITNPDAYTEGNLVGFMNILEACRQYPVEHLVYASSSSVYGNSDESMFAEEQNTDHPVSLYAATKKANEVLAHSYASLYQFPISGLRFFTVYGPFGRPDMAYFKFANAIMEGRPIDIYNHGELYRDFTYIDDIVDGVVRIAAKPPVAERGVAHTVLNIGNHSPVKLSYFIELLEEYLGKTATKNYVGMQPGDVYRTCANVDRIQSSVGFSPSIPIETGLKRFVEWYLQYRQQI